MRVDNQRSGTNTALLCQLSYHASQLPTTQDKPTRADPSPSRSPCPWSYAGPTFSGWLSLWSPRVKRTRRCFGMQTQHRGESHGSHSLHQHYEYSRLASLFLDGPIQGRNSADPTSIIKPRMVMESWIVQRYTCKSSALSMDSIGNAVLEGLVPGRCTQEKLGYGTPRVPAAHGFGHLSVSSMPLHELADCRRPICPHTSVFITLPAKSRCRAASRHSQVLRASAQRKCCWCACCRDEVVLVSF